MNENMNESTCANCGEPWSTAESHLFGQMYDGEWVCSAWCEDCHETEGCPHEQKDGRAEQDRRRGRRAEEAVAVESERKAQR